MSGGKLAQQRSRDRTLAVAPQDGGLRPARANKLQPHPAPGRAMWLVMNSLPFGTVDDVKAPDPAVLPQPHLPHPTVGAVGPGRWSVLERLETCSPLMSLCVTADDVLEHQGAVIPEQERQVPSPQLQHRR